MTEQFIQERSVALYKFIGLEHREKDFNGCWYEPKLELHKDWEFIMAGYQKYNETRHKINQTSSVHLEVGNALIRCSKYDMFKAITRYALIYNEEFGLDKEFVSTTYSFKAVQNLALENSFGVIDTQLDVELDCEINIFAPTRGSFEIYDLESGGNKWHAKGSLQIEGKMIKGYDGVFDLPTAIREKLVEVGYDLSEL